MRRLSPIRVLHLVDSDLRRGAETFAAELATALSEGQTENVLCIVHPSGGGLSHDGLRTVTLGATDHKGWRLVDLAAIRRLHRVLAEFKPDVLLAHGSTTAKYGAVARSMRRGAVSIYKNIGTVSFWSGSPLKARFSRMLLKRFDRVVSLSQITREDFIRVHRLSEHQVVVIPNGLDIAPFSLDSGVREERRRELGLGEGDLALITVGSLTFEKDQARLLSLVKDIRSEGLPCHLLIAGEGPLRAELEIMADQLGISRYVRLLGLRKDVPALLAASDLFVLPSKTEGMPRVLIEAGLAGLASVSHDVGAVADVVENGVSGAVVPAGDYEAFKAETLALLRDPLRRKAMGEAARRHNMRVYDIKKVAQKYQELMISLLNERRDEQYRNFVRSYWMGP
jgi:glycosyltransferase involved in cell wall biosynthesis